jgi:hypothetical protein
MTAGELSLTNESMNSPGMLETLAHGKLIKIRGFPRDKKVKLLRVTVSSHRTEFVATND